jgi:hemerythrin
MLIKEGQIPEVAVKEMNEIHKTEIDILNKLYRAIDAYEENKANADVIDILLDEFIKDVKEHFLFEQELMEKYNFFAYPMHKAEHDRVLHELQSIEKIWKENRDIEFLKNYLEGNFVPWIINHVQTMDTVTAQFLSHFI